MVVCALLLLVYMTIPAMIYSSLMGLAINPKISKHHCVVFIRMSGQDKGYFTSSTSHSLSKVCVVAACFVGCFSGIWIRFIYI